MWPYYDLNDINTVSDILKSGKVNYWTEIIALNLKKNSQECSNVNIQLLWQMDH